MAQDDYSKLRFGNETDNKSLFSKADIIAALDNAAATTEDDRQLFTIRSMMLTTFGDSAPLYAGVVSNQDTTAVMVRKAMEHLNSLIKINQKTFSMFQGKK